MKDIRINKKIIKSSIIRLSILKFNFSFCSKIFVKYNKQEQLGSSLINQASLVFLLNNENDSNDILDSIHKILDVLKKKDEKNELDEEDSSSNVINNEKNILSKKISSINQLNEHKLLDRNLSFYNNLKQENFNQNIKKLILEINNFIKNSQNTSTYLVEKNIISKKLDKENELQKVSYKEKLNKIIKKKKKLKDSNLEISDKISKSEKKESEQIQEEKKNDNEISVNKISEKQKIKDLTSELKKINKKIIESQIKKIKIDKIGFDIVNKSTKFSKNIYNKVNKTIYSVINSDQRIKYFSKASKNIVLFNKKFKSHDIIRDLQNIISSYKENKNIIPKLKLKIKRHKTSNIYNNKLFYKKINKFEDIINYGKVRSISNIKQISNKKTNIDNVDNYKEVFAEKNDKKVFKEKKLKTIISKKDITRSVDLLNELSEKYIINNKNNKKDFHSDQFVSVDNSYFHNIYNHFVKNIKNRNDIKKYNDSTLKYTNFLSEIKKNKLLNFINDINIEKFAENINFKRTNLNFHNFEYHKKITRDNEYFKEFDFENVNNVKEKNIFRNIVHKNEVDIKKVIDECISEKLKKTQEQKFKNTTTHYNERVMRMIENNKKNVNSTEKTISKKEIQEMIDNSIRPISIRRVAELVSERLKRMSSLENYKSTF